MRSATCAAIACGLAAGGGLADPVTARKAIRATVEAPSATAGTGSAFYGTGGTSALGRTTFCSGAVDLGDKAFGAD